MNFCITYKLDTRDGSCENFRTETVTYTTDIKLCYDYENSLAFLSVECKKTLSNQLTNYDCLTCTYTLDTKSDETVRKEIVLLTN